MMKLAVPALDCPGTGRPHLAMRLIGPGIALLFVASLASCALAGGDGDRTLNATKVSDCQKSAEPPGQLDRLTTLLKSDPQKFGLSELDIGLLSQKLAHDPEYVQKGYLWAFCMIGIGAACPPNTTTGYAPHSCTVKLPGGFDSVVSNPFKYPGGSTSLAPLPK